MVVAVGWVWVVAGLAGVAVGFAVRAASWEWIGAGGTLVRGVSVLLVGLMGLPAWRWSWRGRGCGYEDCLSPHFLLLFVFSVSGMMSTAG